MPRCPERTSDIARRISPAKLQCELDFSARGGRRSQHTRGRGGASREIENIRIEEPYPRHSAVRVGHNIKNFRSELHVEALRNPLDRLILKNGKIQVHCPRPGQEVATG